MDAGCAAGIAPAVVQPDIVNFAGVAPILIRKANGHVEIIAGLGHWPAGIPADLFMREHGGQIPQGVLRMAVPAAPDARIQALDRHGTMRFADVASGAIHLAEDGFAVHEGLVASTVARAADFVRWPENVRLFLPDGRSLRVEEKFVQSDLARTLRYMADDEIAAAPRGWQTGFRAAF